MGKNVGKYEWINAHVVVLCFRVRLCTDKAILGRGAILSYRCIIYTVSKMDRGVLDRDF
jgi:acetyltransferase-like isoleucine patch superfamily enzyme